MNTNLWPDFKPADFPPTPKSIIKEAGTGLTEKTGSLVRFYSGGMTFSDQIASMNFNLFAPRISYMYPFLNAKFPMATFYPVRLFVADIDKPLVANNEAELLEALKQVFNAPSTVATIQQLLALSK